MLFKDREIVSLMAKLPTGVNDPRSLEKLRREYAEFKELRHYIDPAGALLEQADCYYYMQKCFANGIVFRAVFTFFFAWLLGRSRFATIRQAAVRKYQLRARTGNPKDDTAERRAVQDLIR